MWSPAVRGTGADMTDEPHADEPTADASAGVAERDGIVDQHDAVLSKMDEDHDDDGETGSVNDTEDRYGEDESPA